MTTKKKARARVRAAQWRAVEANAERQRAHARVSNIRRYGLTMDAYHAMLQEQSWRCAICGCSFLVLPGMKAERPCVDHDHVTGAVRGLLCNQCNATIGMAGDRVDVLAKAIAYLMRAKR